MSPSIPELNVRGRRISFLSPIVLSSQSIISKDLFQTIFNYIPEDYLRKTKSFFLEDKEYRGIPLELDFMVQPNEVMNFHLGKNLLSSKYFHSITASNLLLKQPQEVGKLVKIQLVFVKNHDGRIQLGTMMR